jgi:hypothetical protein
MPTHDIGLGPNQWLKWVDTTDTQTLNIDNFVDYTQPLWQLLETECVAGCCGLDAFDFWADQVAQLPLSSNERADLKQRLARVISELKQASHQSLLSYRLNSGIDKGVFVQLLEHLGTHL